MFDKNDKPLESIFKNSRLMLHEIVTSEDEDWINLSALGEEEKDSTKDILEPNQRLEVVKITRCKMRQKDVLEIEIGLKNLTIKNKPFEER
jgi:hypothetical protein